MNDNIEKLFLEERSGTITKTLKEAKKCHTWPYISRVWMQNGTILGKVAVVAYGDSCGTIRAADEYISKHLKK